MDTKNYKTNTACKPRNTQNKTGKVKLNIKHIKKFETGKTSDSL